MKLIHLLAVVFFSSSYLICCSDGVRMTGVSFNRSLETVSVRCCAIVYDPLVYEDNTRTPPFDGLSIEALSALQDVTGFGCSSFKQFEPSGTKDFNEFVDMLANCTENGVVREDSECECDFGVSGWWENPSRVAVEFLPEHAFDSMNVVTHVDNTSRSLAGAFFLYNFSLTVWLAIFGLIVAFIFLHVIDHRFKVPQSATSVYAQRSHPNAPGVVRRFTNVFLHSPLLVRTQFSTQVTVGKMIGYSHSGDGTEDHSVHQWILSVIIVLCGLFLALAYEASMTALLVVDNPSSEFRTVRDIKECRIPDSDFCISAGDGVDFYWNATIQTQPCRKGKDTGPVRLTSYEEVLEHVATKKCKYLLADDGLLISSIKKKYCGVLTKTGETLFTKGVSFVVPFGWKYNTELRKGSVLLHENRLIPTMEDYNEDYVTCDLSTPPQLDFKKLRVFFIIAYTTCAVLFLDILLVNRRTG